MIMFLTLRSHSVFISNGNVSYKCFNGEHLLCLMNKNTSGICIQSSMLLVVILCVYP
jgi:hypothetical protein